MRKMEACFSLLWSGQNSPDREPGGQSTLVKSTPFPSPNIHSFSYRARTAHFSMPSEGVGRSFAYPHTERTTLG